MKLSENRPRAGLRNQVIPLELHVSNSPHVDVFGLPKMENFQRHVPNGPELQGEGASGAGEAPLAAFVNFAELISQNKILLTVCLSKRLIQTLFC